MFDELSRDFGSVPHGQTLVHPFRLVNNTGNTVRITSIRVPFVVMWKGKLPAGKTYDHPVISLDILPTSTADDRALHGAACHGCLLIAETSCEARNLFLDRSLLVETMATQQAALFHQ